MTDKGILRRQQRVEARVGRRRRVSPWLVWLIGLPAAGLLGGLLHLAGYGPFQGLIAGLEQEEQLHEEITHLEEQNEALQEEINALMPGEFGIEKRAREQLGWSRPGEVVIYLPEKR